MQQQSDFLQQFLAQQGVNVPSGYDPNAQATDMPQMNLNVAPMQSPQIPQPSQASGGGALTEFVKQLQQRSGTLSGKGNTAQPAQQGFSGLGSQLGGFIKNKFTNQDPTQAEPQNTPAPIQLAENDTTNQGDFSLQNIVQSAIATYGDTPQARVAASQAVLESGLLGGKPSQLAAKYNNLFGIKGNGTAGTAEMPTHEFLNGSMQKTNANFAAYNSIDDSFNSHRELMSKSRYSDFLHAQDTPSAFHAINKSGYATDPNYGPKLEKIYNNVLSPYFDSMSQINAGEDMGF